VKHYTIWTAVECNGVIYCTVVMSYCPRPKLLQNRQSIFVLLSHHQKCTLIGEITALYFHESLIRTPKIPHNFNLWQVLQFIYWLTSHSGVFTEYNEWFFLWHFLVLLNSF